MTASFISLILSVFLVENDVLKIASLVILFIFFIVQKLQKKFEIMGVLVLKPNEIIANIKNDNVSYKLNSIQELAGDVSTHKGMADFSTIFGFSNHSGVGNYISFIDSNLGEQKFEVFIESEEELRNIKTFIKNSSATARL